MGSETKHVYLVRHAQSRTNASGIIEEGDTPLTEKGEEQLRAVSARFEKIEVDVVLASPRLRSQKTGQAIAKITGAGLVTVEDAYERRFPSSIVGTLGDKKERIVEAQREGWVSGKNFEDGEAFESLIARADKLEQAILDRPEQHVVFSGHGFFNRLFGLHILLRNYLTPKLFVRRLDSGMPSTNTGITYFTIEGGTWKLRAWNDHAHLG